VAAGSYRSRIEVAVKAAAVSGVHAAREAAGRGSQWLGQTGGQWHAAPVCKKQRAEATNGSGELEGGDTWHRRAGRDEQRRSAEAHVGGVHMMPVCGKRRAVVANGSGGLEGGDSVG
jgi:hypothetical protein